MKIILIGYGKMGQEIEKEAQKENHEIVSKINKTPHLEDLKGSDIAIEFSNPKSAPKNIQFCLENHIPIVCGTTGWMEKFNFIKSICDQTKGSFFYAPNFSIGVNIFFELSKLSSNLISKYPEYKIEIKETHHKEKKDTPSGTALFLRELLSSSINLKSHLNKIPIQSNRLENEIGTHTLSYYNDLEEIQITHKALDRSLFAKGALLAAKWLIGKKGVFSMKDFLNF